MIAGGVGGAFTVDGGVSRPSAEVNGTGDTDVQPLSAAPTSTHNHARFLLRERPVIIVTPSCGRTRRPANPCPLSSARKRAKLTGNACYGVSTDFAGNDAGPGRLDKPGNWAALGIRAGWESGRSCG